MWKVLILLAVASGALGGIHPLQRRPDPNLELFKEQCQKYGVSVEALEESTVTLVNCMQNIANVDELKNEFSRGSNSSMKESLKTVCSKVPNFKTCMTTFSNSIEPCAGSKKQEFELNMKAFYGMIDFACFNEGQRLIEFVNDGGIQCLQTNYAALQNCMSNVRDSGSSLVIISDAATSDNIKAHCTKTEELRTCVVDIFKACPNPSPAHFFDSIIQIGINGLPCNQVN